MKALVSTLFILSMSSFVQASDLFQQLCEFNFNWKKYSDHFNNEPGIDFQSDQAYIQTHLTHVLEVLKSNSVDHLSEDQLASRLKLIEELDVYRQAGLFPMNYYRKERIPVFIDEHNTHCAVGYLLMKTGFDEVAQRIAANENYAWVKDIEDKALPAWQKASGFTMEELKLIQGAYDYYMPDALILPNKYEIPQKPIAETRYFDKDKKHVWLSGEGRRGVLHGKWIQNYSESLPWIEGYYEHGKRTGKWKEYYQGTDKLCRTEIWRDDKLNGVRKCFDREGLIIEEILFKDGEAITKINYDIYNGLKWVRVPLDSVHVKTKVYDNDGVLLATGHEKIYNPGNLLWFQNIELTALNSASITSREVTLGNQISDSRFLKRRRHIPGLNSFPQQFQSFQSNSPALVEYHKLGEWTYYKQWTPTSLDENKTMTVKSILASDFKYFGSRILEDLYLFDDLVLNDDFDSLHVLYANNKVIRFLGQNESDYVALRLDYTQGLSLLDHVYDIHPSHQTRFVIKTIGQLNKNHQKIGVWKHYDLNQRLIKTEQFIVPQQDDLGQIANTELNAILEKKSLSLNVNQH